MQEKVTTAFSTKSAVKGGAGGHRKGCLPGKGLPSAALSSQGMSYLSLVSCCLGSQWLLSHKPRYTGADFAPIIFHFGSTGFFPSQSSLAF